jgi:putative ATP-dependent endonuclease of OLD family
MKIKSLHIKNFRLLRDVNISLEDMTTVIVGRNNSGKTSLTEIFRRLLSDKAPYFSLYDFNVATIEEFKHALALKIEGAELGTIRGALPFIQIALIVGYDPAMLDLGLLGNFIVDLNPGCHETKIIIRYYLQDGRIDDFFDGFADTTPTTIKLFLKELKDRIYKYFTTGVTAQDPYDETNSLVVDYAKFRQLIGAGFINAQRGLDDITHTEKDVLGKILAKLFRTANAESAPGDMKGKSDELQAVVAEIQSKVDTDFNQKLDALLPALNIFGYPGLADPNLSTETTIDVANILDSHTRIRYSQGNGIYLPETYNGLGSRNLIYILFQLFEFFRDWQSQPVVSSLFLIFIEEPEAHLHPQMQQVFIKQIGEIASEFSRTLNAGRPWQVQFVITTHSTHIANEAKFESIRYFLTARNEQMETRVKDLRVEFTNPDLQRDKEFLYKYLTLTKCDLYFADKAILIEGPTERILMPVLISKADLLSGGGPKLATQYISVIEVGGAYVHHFSKFLDFLELRTLVVTDLDSVIKTESEGGKTSYPACEVAKGTNTSNAGIKNWFGGTIEGYMPLSDCMRKTAEQKLSGSRRIAYQIPESGRTCCARTFEDALMLANIAHFGIAGDTDELMALHAYEKIPDKHEKTSFAMKYGVEYLEWNLPRYIIEGLQWLSVNPNIPSAIVREAIAETVE